MPEFSNREQLLSLKLRWTQHRLKGLEERISDINLCLVALSHYSKDLEKYLDRLASDLTESEKIRGYILHDISEISGEIKNLMNL